MEDRVDKEKCACGEDGEETEGLCDAFLVLLILVV